MPSRMRLVYLKGPYSLIERTCRPQGSFHEARIAG